MRKHPRYPVLMDAMILTSDGRGIPAMVTDLSTGGAGIETVPAVASDLGQFTLVVVEPNFELPVECEARNVQELWSKRVIHAQFIGHDHREPLEDVIQQVQAESSNVSPFPVAVSGPASIVRRLFRRRAA